MARKGLAASDAIARLATSTWGPSQRNTRLLYTAAVRPILLYGSQEWSMRIAQQTLPKSRIKPLERVQNICLRRITGGYKRTPIAALEREAHVPPLDIQAIESTNKQILRTRCYSVTKRNRAAARTIWIRMRSGVAPMPKLTRSATTTALVHTVQEARTVWHSQATRRIGGQSITEDAILREKAQQDWKARWVEHAARPRGHHPPVT